MLRVQNMPMRGRVKRGADQAPSARSMPPARIVGAVRAHRAEGRAIVITYSAAQYAGYLALAPDLVYSLNIPDGAALDAHLARLDTELAGIVAEIRRCAASLRSSGTTAP